MSVSPLRWWRSSSTAAATPFVAERTIWAVLVDSGVAACLLT
ncbi:hypothetical protein [Streptomyces sp. NPDC002619]